MTTHSSIVRRWLSLRAYGLFTSTLFRATTPPAVMRARFERFGTVSRDAMQRKHPRVAFADHAIGALAMESVRAVATPSCIILHLHGGAFFMGSAQSYRNRALRLSYRCNAEVFVPDYRLAPEHVYPAALDDALIAFQYVTVLRRGLPVFVSGDSAGGGLSLSLMLRLRALGAEMPRGAVLLSPWTDLTSSGSSVEGNAKRDLWLSRRHLETWARYYAGSADPRTPLLSPVFADLSGLPPSLLVVGEHEVLLDDALRIRDAAARAAAPVELHVGKGMQHDFPLTLPWLDESRAAWSAMQRFIETHSGRAASARGHAQPSADLEPKAHA